MKKGLWVGIGIALGYVASLITQGLPLRAQVDGGGGTVTKNGDVNGDGKIDISDAVYLLSWLFQGGGAPVEIDCGPPSPPPTAAKVRFFNDRRCNNQPTTATLTLCGVTLTDVSDGSESSCEGVETTQGCVVKVTAATDCGETLICGEITLQTGIVYDFVLSGDAGPSLSWIEQPLDTAGGCPSFLPPDTPSTGAFGPGCDGRDG
jgi:hypothetical protein